MVEITSEEQNKVKRMKTTEDSLRNLWENIKCTNIWIIGIAEEEEKKKGCEKMFEEIIVEIFPNGKSKSPVKSKRHKESHTGKTQEKHTKAHTNQTNKE